MNSLKLSSVLDHVESQLELFSEALTGHQADQMAEAAKALQAAAVNFSKLFQQQPIGSIRDVAMQLRLKRVAASLASRRENLIRCSVMVDRALAAIVPASQSDTYAPSKGALSRQAYGSAGRQSGEFKGFSI
jgi:hypothetical protein